MTLYDHLGISQGATAAEIKAAHRRRAKLTHPDAGGDREAFDRVQHAFTVLSHPARREQYDRTGVEDDEPASAEERAVLSLVGGALLTAVNGDADLARLDVLALARAGLETAIAGLEAQPALLDRRLERTATVKARLQRTRPGEDDDALARVLDQQTKDIHRARAQNEQALRVHRAALEILVGYSYRTDAEPPQDSPLSLLGLALRARQGL